MNDKELSRKVIKSLIKKDGRTVTEIAGDLGVSSQRLGQYQNGKRFPDAVFIQKWAKTFGHNLMELMEKETGGETNVSRETGNHTSVQNRSDNKGKQDIHDAIRRVVEDGTEYLVIPKVVLEGKYRLMPIEQIEKDAKELEDRSLQIQSLHGIIRDFASRPVNIQLSEVQKAK